MSLKSKVVRELMAYLDKKDADDFSSFIKPAVLDTKEEEPEEAERDDEEHKMTDEEVAELMEALRSKLGE